MRRAAAARRAVVARRAAVARGIALAAAACLVILALPGPVAAHQLTGRFESPLPLATYLAGAAIAVALSFGLVLSRRSVPTPPAPSGPAVSVPRWLRLGLQALGLLAWAWALADSLLVPVPGDADAGSLFLWTYGWVGLALVSALVGPAWSWLDPFSTLARLAAGAGRLVGIRGPRPAAYPAALGRWPALIGYAFFVWLELAVTGGGGGRVLGLGLLGYTAVTLAAMLVYGRDTWRREGETFSVWFELVGRLAPLALDGPPESGRLVRRRLGAGLYRRDWATPEIALVALAVAGVIFDGLSQTNVWFDLFGPRAPLATTVQLAGFATLIVALVLAVTRVAGRSAVGAGLVPIATGYIIAHYLTFLLTDGQRILLVLDDPLAQGWHLLGLAEWEPSGAWLAPPLVWAAMLLAVVGGHVLGALSGHGAAALEVEASFPPLEPARGAAAGEPAADPPRRFGADALAALRRRELPLACLMVGLTVLTLWSLGQVVVRPGG